MSLADLTYAAVAKAIEEFDLRGRSAFLEKYGFGQARSYFVVRDGKHYDSKAIAGAAHGYLEGQKPLRPADFSGGDRTVKVKLEKLGFKVERARIIATPDPMVVVAPEVSFPLAVDPALVEVAEPHQAARLPGRPYTGADENPGRSPSVPFEVDPDLIDRGTRAHATTQNALAAFLRHHGVAPRSPDRERGEPEFDLAWAIHERVYVAEVKSLTADNEERQLRLGLGQVLRYRHQLRSEHRDVVGVLVAERQPTDHAWPELCGELKILLAWSGSFELITRDWGSR